MEKNKWASLMTLSAWAGVLGQFMLNNFGVFVTVILIALFLIVGSRKLGIPPEKEKV